MKWTKRKQNKIEEEEEEIDKPSLRDNKNNHIKQNKVKIKARFRGE